MKTLTLTTLFLLVLANLFSQSWEEIDKLRLEYEQKASYDTALIYAEQAIQIAKEKHADNDTLYASSLNNKGCIYMTQGNYKPAEELIDEALKILKKKKTIAPTTYTVALNNIATLYNWTSRYEPAEKVYKEVIEIREKLLGKNNPVYATSLNNLANLYKDMGRFQESEALYLETIKIRKETIGENDPEYAVALNNLAILYHSMGMYEKVEKILLQSKEILKDAPGDGQIKYLTTINNLGGLYWSLSQFDKAEPMFEEVSKKLLELVGEMHPNYITSLGNLAVVYSNTKKEKKAIEIYLKVIELKEEVHGRMSIDCGIALNNLGVSYMKQYVSCETDECRKENIEKALAANLEALEIRKKLVGTKHQDYDLSLKNLANTYWYKGDLDEAAKTYLKSLAIIDFNLKQNFSFLSEKEKELYYKLKYNDIKSFYSFAYLYQQQEPSFTTHVYNNVLKNKGLLLKSSTAMRNSIIASNDTSLTAKYDKWLQVRKEIAQLYSLAIDKRDKDPAILEEEANLIEKELVSKSQEFSEYYMNEKTTWKDVQKGLKDNEAAIEFIHFRMYNKAWIDSIYYYALIIKPDSKYPEMIRLFEENKLIEIIDNYTGNNMEYIKKIYGTTTNKNEALYQLIWQPIDNSLKDINTVYVSPSGLLHKISLSALGKDQNIYLCDKLDIRTQSSTLKTAYPEHFEFEKDYTISIFGGIEYDSDSSNNKVWGFLEGTKTESEKIKSILEKKKISVKYYTSKDATETEFKEIASNSNMIHIATHGFFYPDPNNIIPQKDSLAEDYGEVVFRGASTGFGVDNFVKNENPLMRSGLVFAGANDVWNKQDQNQGDDGVLTAQEVANIKMNNTGLVVLSACETGLGDINGSEGVYGLQRAFKMAGVKFMIMSLWQVPDKETEEFMIDFYINLIKLKDIRIAFNNTQKDMRTKYDPYYWAAFVLIE